ncbi:MAG: hypothetical protein ACOCRK_09990 [bacterium]
MRKFLFVSLLILFIFSIVVNADNYDRVNEELPTVSALIAELKGATGWMKDSTGQWISKESIIPVDNGKDYNEYALGIDNFENLELRTIQIEGQEYYVLTKKHLIGAYEYPSIKEGWYLRSNHTFYVIKKSQLNKFALKDNILEPQIVEIKYLYFGHAGRNTLDVNTIEKGVKEILNFGDNSYFEGYLVFNILPLPENNVVSFTLMNKSETSIGFIYRTESYIERGSDFSVIDAKMKELLRTPETFHKAYYEVDYEKFTNIFPLE